MSLPGIEPGELAWNDSALTIRPQRQGQIQFTDRLTNFQFSVIYSFVGDRRVLNNDKQCKKITLTTVLETLVEIYTM